eukprot:11553840-Ditylum_brightwellii.AAC.1
MELIMEEKQTEAQAQASVLAELKQRSLLEARLKLDAAVRKMEALLSSQPEIQTIDTADAEDNILNEDVVDSTQVENASIFKAVEEVGPQEDIYEPRQRALLEARL